MNLIVFVSNSSKVFCEKDLFIVLAPSKILDLPMVLMLGRTHTDFTPLLTPVLSSCHGHTALHTIAYNHGLRRPNEAFSLKSRIFGLEQTNWADKF